MKILLRDALHIGWIDATWDGNKYYYNRDDGIADATESDILSIKDAESSAYVKCSSCGEIIPNNDYAIKKHKERSLTNKTCFNCIFCRKDNITKISEKYKKLENGKYLINESKEVRLICTNGYRYVDINSDERQSGCRYSGCTRASFAPVPSIFTEMPGVFDKMITSDKIIDNGYSKRAVYPEYSKYLIKARNTIEAYVNDQNIVTKFRVCYKDYADIVYYSAKYDKLFTTSNGKYIEWKPSNYRFPEHTQAQIKTKIASLYN